MHWPDQSSRAPEYTDLADDGTTSTEQEATQAAESTNNFRSRLSHMQSRLTKMRETVKKNWPIHKITEAQMVDAFWCEQEHLGIETRPTDLDWTRRIPRVSSTDTQQHWLKGQRLTNRLITKQERCHPRELMHPQHRQKPLYIPR